MTLRLLETEIHEIRQLCSELQKSPSTSIWQVAKVIGKLVAAFPATQYGPLLYRSIEKDKVVALKLNRGHFDRKMSLSQESKQELQWWISNIISAYMPIRKPNPTTEIRTDASGSGWGVTDLHTSTGGT